ncbi:MAG: RNA polymerase factor sigma-54 [Gammaproteobacteria bacterium]
MKQSLQLKLGQSLTMTPQLRQAIRLLQLSTLDLQTEIQEQLDSNMMLEADDDLAENFDADGLNGAEREASGNDNADPGNTEGSQEQDSTPGTDSQTLDSVASESNDIPEDLPVDAAWDDIYDPIVATGSAPVNDEGPEFYEVAGAQNGASLQEHLIWQLDLSPFSPQDQAIAEAIIDSLNDDGYLTADLEELRDGLQLEEEVEMDEVEAVLRRIQNFDPVGVAARSPAECLSIQLHALPAETPDRSLAMRIVRDHLELMSTGNVAQLARKVQASADEVEDAIKLIRTLQPYPGSLVSSSTTDYVVPDVFIRRVNGAWRVELNPETTPKIRINPLYAGMVKRGDNGADNTSMRNHLQEARWFLKSLQSRSETLLKVATAIVERQLDFFEQGDEAMQPLVLRDIAEAVDMHESTISRVTTRKYMHTPRGIYEFKFFFSSHVGTADGGECSATAIRAKIKRMVADENPAKPLSDSKIANTLAEEGINVARRTIAKYREAMNIPPSNERKRLG